MPDLSCNLIPNKWHQKGDKKPCLVNHWEQTIEIIEPGEYTVSIWPPKDGKKSYFMVMKKKEREDGAKEQTKKEDKEQTQPISTVKPIFKNSIFNV